MREELQPLLDLCCTAHYWRASDSAMRHRESKLSEAAIEGHISGKWRIGLCPMAPGSSTTQVALLDVDDVNPDNLDDLDMIASITFSAEVFLNLRANRTWSSSGAGCHLYFIWETPQDAYSVRTVLWEVLRRCNLDIGVGGLPNGEVEVFPKQDQVPASGWGSMFILPFGGSTKSCWMDPLDSWQYSNPVPTLPKPDLTVNINDISYDLEYIEEVLNAIPNSEADSLPYDDWFRTIAAIHHATAGSEDGKALALTFSRRSSKHDEAFFLNRVWPYLNDDRPTPVTFKSVEHLARSYGWRPTSIFEDLGELPEGETVPVSDVVVPLQAFTGRLEAPHYVWDEVLQQGCLYALTARWGHGKTAVALSIALHVAAGLPLHGRQTAPGAVLYLCGENPADVRLRVTAALLHFGIPASHASNIYFTQRPFALDDPQSLRSFLKHAIPHAPYALAVIDTGPAHSLADEENDNRQMHALAIAMRDFMLPLGNPATLALMHPSKDASKEALQPRGGGAFSGSIDGELCAWHEPQAQLIEFFHRTKFRGPGFNPLYFRLSRVTLPDMETNFGKPVTTVVATPTTPPLPNPKGKWPPLVWDAFQSLEGVAGEPVSFDDLLAECLAATPAPAGRDTRPQHIRRALELLESGGWLKVEDENYSRYQ